jgi:uncharacterized membrane protein YkoI
MAGLAGIGIASEKKVELKDLPAAAQKTIRAETSGAKIKDIIEETQKGQTVYEVETVLNSGKTRDFDVDKAGTVLEVELEVALDSIPAPAKATIQKIVGNARINKVEALSKKGKTDYEAAYMRDGKEREVLVKADGTLTKDSAAQ